MQLIGENIVIRSTIKASVPQIIDLEKSNAPFVDTYSLQEHLLLLKTPDCLHLSIFNKKSNILIGHIICFGMHNKYQALEIRRITIAEKGLGYGREALQIIKKFCFEKLGFHRLWLDVYQHNARAIALYESEGFNYEGTLRDCVKRKHNYDSLRIYAMLDNEYYH